MKRKKIIQYVIGWGLILVFFFITRNESIQSWFSNNACNSTRESIMDLEIKGVVLTKYLDEKSHMHETINVENNGVTLKVIIPNEYSGLYQFIQKGDSIFKEENSLHCKVKRAQKDKDFFIDFRCN